MKARTKNIILLASVFSLYISANIYQSNKGNYAADGREYKVGYTICYRNNSLFKSGTNSLVDSSKKSLDSLVLALKKKDHLGIWIESYTCNTRRQKANIKNCNLKMYAIRQYLISKGVSKFKIRETAHGSKKNISSNFTKEGRASNNKIIFTLYYCN